MNDLNLKNIQINEKINRVNYIKLLIKKLKSNSFFFFSFKLHFQFSIPLRIENCEEIWSYKFAYFNNLNQILLSIPLIDFAYMSLEAHREGEYKGFPYMSGIFAVHSPWGANPYLFLNLYELFMGYYPTLQLKELIEEEDIKETFFAVIREHIYENQAYFIYSKLFYDFHSLLIDSFEKSFIRLFYQNILIHLTPTPTIPPENFLFGGCMFLLDEFKEHLIYNNISVFVQNLPNLYFNKEPMIAMILMYMQCNFMVFEKGSNYCLQKKENTQCTYEIKWTLDRFPLKEMLEFLLEKLPVHFKNYNFGNLLNLLPIAPRIKLIKEHKELFPWVELREDVMEFRDGIYLMVEDKFLSFKKLEKEGRLQEFKVFVYVAKNYGTVKKVPQRWLAEVQKYLQSKKLPTDKTMVHRYCREIGRMFRGLSFIKRRPSKKYRANKLMVYVKEDVFKKVMGKTLRKEWLWVDDLEEVMGRSLGLGVKVEELWLQQLQLQNKQYSNVLVVMSKFKSLEAITVLV